MPNDCFSFLVGVCLIWFLRLIFQFRCVTTINHIHLSFELYGARNDLKCIAIAMDVRGDFIYFEDL